MHAEIRYGAHDRRPRAGGATFLLNRLTGRGGSTVSTGENEEAIPPWLGGKRKAATVAQLMKLLNIPEDHRSKIMPNLITGKEGEMVLADPQQEQLEADMRGRESDNMELLSEVEEGGGLELPVRLDFQLQEELTERYISQLGTLQSHFNYWLSRDAVFFMLKEITNFRPRVSNPDFLQILKYSERHSTSKDSSNEIGVDVLKQQPSISVGTSPQMRPQIEPESVEATDPNRLSVESPRNSPPRRLPTRTLKRAPLKGTDTFNGSPKGGGGEAGKTFFG